VPFARCDSRNTLRKLCPQSAADRQSAAYCGFAVYWSACGNGALDCDEIWYGCWSKQTTHSCRVSRESNVPFVRYEGRNAQIKLCPKRRIVGLPVLGSVRRLPFLNGWIDSSQIRQAARDTSSAGARKLSFRSVRPIEFYRSRAASCRPSLQYRPLAVERRAPSSVYWSRMPTYPHKNPQADAAGSSLDTLQISSGSNEPCRNGNRRTEPNADY